MAPRSQCPSCHHQLAWYDLIPVLSWFFLAGKCRYCKKHISALYPFIEVLTPVVMLPLFYLFPAHYIPAYFIFFSALIITIRSDLELMLISRFATIFLIPFGILFSWFGLLPISPFDSLFGAALGYGFLYAMAKIFKFATGKDGMGEGDLELLAYIGSFTGAIGCWFSLLSGSIMGSLCGLFYMLFKGNSKNVKIPFGPFLAFSAMLYVYFHNTIIAFFLPT